MNYLTIISFLMMLIGICIGQRQGERQGMFKLKGDFMDVPLRASYKIMGSDDDGFLEDGIIVKQKGTGYIDNRFRNRNPEPMRQSASQIIYGRPVWFRQ